MNNTQNEEEILPEKALELLKQALQELQVNYKTHLLLGRCLKTVWDRNTINTNPISNPEDNTQTLIT